jgi:hypothetical protein
MPMTPLHVKLDPGWKPRNFLFAVLSLCISGMFLWAIWMLSKELYQLLEHRIGNQENIAHKYHRIFFIPIAFWFAWIFLACIVQCFTKWQMAWKGPLWTFLYILAGFTCVGIPYSVNVLIEERIAAAGYGICADLHMHERFANVTLFRKSAEVCRQYLDKNCTRTGSVTLFCSYKGLEINGRE